MTRLAFWSDDGQVAQLMIRKQWGECPGIGIIAFEVQETY